MANNLVYIVLEYSEDVGPGSSPMVETHLFKSVQSRLAWINKWVAQNIECTHERDDEEPLKFFGNKDWVYWLECESQPLL